MGWHNQTIGPNPKKLCWRCKYGDHSWRHSELGCLEIPKELKPPRDFLCACEVKGRSGASRRAFAFRGPLT